MRSTSAADAEIVDSPRSMAPAPYKPGLWIVVTVVVAPNCQFPSIITSPQSLDDEKSVLMIVPVVITPLVPVESASFSESAPADTNKSLM